MMNSTRRIGISLIAVLSGFCLASPAWAALYRYTDDEGRTHVVESRTQIPERYRDKAVEIRGTPAQQPLVAPQAPSGGSGPGDAPPGEGTPKRVGIDVDADGNGPEYWASRLKAIRDREAQIDARIKEIEDMGDIGTEQFASPAAIQLGYNLGKEKEELLKEKAEIPKKIAGLREEARRKNAPPGWLR